MKRLNKELVDEIEKEAKDSLRHRKNHDQRMQAGEPTVKG